VSATALNTAAIRCREPGGWAAPRSVRARTTRRSRARRLRTGGHLYIPRTVRVIGCGSEGSVPQVSVYLVVGFESGLQCVNVRSMYRINIRIQPVGLQR
jgi:hypothetical protein